jgi:hypothetical protein
MGYLHIYAKCLSVLALSAMVPVGAYAQLATPVVSVKAGKIFVADGANKKVVATAAHNIQPLAAPGHVFYINNTIVGKMVIKAYDVATNTTTDAVKAESLNSGTPTEKKIINLVFDKVENRLYFSTLSVSANGYENYLTWYLNPLTNAVKLFADGKLTAIDENTGAVHSEMHGIDGHGSYTQTHTNSKDGTSGVIGTRVYTNTTVNQSGK